MHSEDKGRLDMMEGLEVGLQRGVGLRARLMEPTERPRLHLG